MNRILVLFRRNVCLARTFAIRRQIFVVAGEIHVQHLPGVPFEVGQHPRMRESLALNLP